MHAHAEGSSIIPNLFQVNDRSGLSRMQYNELYHPRQYMYLGKESLDGIMFESSCCFFIKLLCSLTSKWKSRVFNCDQRAKKGGDPELPMSLPAYFLEAIKKYLV